MTDWKASAARSVPTTVPMFLRVWPNEVEGCRLYLKGSILIPGKVSRDCVEASKQVLCSYDH